MTIYSALGMLPTLGIHHHNKYNAYALADDIMKITDKQFGIIELFYSKKEAKKPGMHQQLSLF